MSPCQWAPLPSGHKPKHEVPEPLMLKGKEPEPDGNFQRGARGQRQVHGLEAAAGSFLPDHRK